MKTLDWAAAAALVALAFYLLTAGEALLLPLVIAVAFWHLINTLARAFHRLSVGRFRIPMPLCLAASILSFLLSIWAVVDFLGNSVEEVVEAAPAYQENLTRRLNSLPFVDAAAFEDRSFSQLLTEWIDIPAYAASIASSFAGVLASGGLILIYLGFLFLEQGRFGDKLAALVADPGKEENARRIFIRIRDDIQKYIGIKVLTSTLTGVISYAFLVLAGIDFAEIWGLLIFLLNFIPTIGSIVATVFPAMIALAQSEGYTLFFVVLLGIGAVQVGIGNILEPRLMGSSFNLSPLVILVNLALWGYIWGVPGMFLCVPLLIIVAIVLSYFPRTRPLAIILSSDGRLRVPAEKAVDPFALRDPGVLLGDGREGPERDG